MSQVRMCDRNGELFSENEAGWSTAQATTMIVDEATGERRSVQRQMDLCPACAKSSLISPKVRAAVAAVAAPLDEG